MPHVIVKLSPGKIRTAKDPSRRGDCNWDKLYKRPGYHVNDP